MMAIFNGVRFATRVVAADTCKPPRWGIIVGGEAFTDLIRGASSLSSYNVSDLSPFTMHALLALIT